MSKAEEKALKKYPAERGHMHDRPYQREGFIEGFHQAEKDMELTWEDLKTLDDISYDVYDECDVGMFDEKEFYQEVLKRFKERKEK